MTSFRQIELLTELVNNPSIIDCFEALMNNNNAFRHINKKTIEKIKIAYLEKEPLAKEVLLLIKKHQINAVSKNGLELRKFKFQIKKACKIAVRQNYLALQFVKNQTIDIILAACLKNRKALIFVRNPTPEIYMAVVKQDGLALHNVRNQTHEICMAAVNQNGLALQYVKEKTFEIYVAAINQNLYAVKHIDNNDLIKASNQLPNDSCKQFLKFINDKITHARSLVSSYTM
jgi:hypothetical protein